MTDLAADADDVVPQDESKRDEAAQQPEEQPTQDQAPVEQPGDPVEQQPEETPAAEVAAISARLGQQGMQESLFFVDAPMTSVDESDEGVTTFNAPEPEAPAEAEVAPAEAAEVDDLAAVRAELSGETPAPAEAEETSLEETAAPAASPDPDAVAAAAAAPAPVVGSAAQVLEASELAEEEAVAAVVEAGAPEGADDDLDAVEALLDAESSAGMLEPAPKDRVLSVPYFVYDGVWLLFTVGMVAALADAARAGKLDAAASYPLFVFGGLFLTVLGPVLALLLWGVKRSRTPKGQRAGLFAIALLRGSLATFAGVAMWLIGLVVLNWMKTGRIL